MKRYKHRLAMILLMAVILCLSGCADRLPQQQEETAAAEVSIPIMLTVDPTSGNKSEEELVNNFNEAYKGSYRLEVEWILATEEENRQNIKRLNVLDKLPAVITDLKMLPSFNQMMIKNQRIIELGPVIEGDQEWLAAIEPEVLQSCTEEDGSIYLSGTGTAAFTCAGIYWNEELFARAGIKEFPDTWEGFWQCVERLEQAGITPLALHTEGTAWAPLLFATAELGTADEGLAFMKTVFPDSYQNASGRRLAETLKRLFAYTNENAMHSDFDVAYTNFFSGKAAMIPNGYWMINQMPEEWQERVRFSAFPENRVVSSPDTFGWAVAADYDEAVQAGAAAFLKFRTMEALREKQELLASDPEKNSQVLNDYIEVIKNQPVVVPNYQTKWNSILQEETLGEILPLLTNQEITTDQFVRMADESIRQFQMEQ